MSATAPSAERAYDVLDALHAHARAGMAAQAVGALIVGFICFPHASVTACGAWITVWLVACLMRWQALRGYRWWRLQPQGNQRSALSAWDRANLAGGGLWGLAAVLFFPVADGSAQIGLTVLVCSLCLVLPAGAYRVYVTTAALGFVPLMAMVMINEAHGLSLAMVLVLVFFSSLLVAQAYRMAFRHVFALKGEAEALAGELAIEKRRAEEATASRTRFYTAASHDLRQPLQSLLILAESLRRQPLPPQAAAQASRLQQSVRALEGLFDALLDIGQLDAGTLQPRLRAVRLEPLFRRIGLHWRTTAFDRGLSLDFRGGEHWVQADPVLLERVLRNLVANAVECTVDGGVLVTCRSRQGGRCLLQVWDTGPGMPADVLPRIFDEFYRGQASSASRGLGLGLTIAQAFSQLMGSRLVVRSAPGRGSVFSLELPCAQPETSPPTSAPAALVSLAGRRMAVFAAQLPQAGQVVDQLRLWHADVAQWEVEGPWPAAAPDVIVLGAMPLAQQQAVLLRWRQTWPDQPAAALLMAPADHPSAAWGRLVRLSQPLAAHRLRSALIALQPGAAPTALKS